MKVYLVDAVTTLGHDNDGLSFGLEEINMGDYVEWFKTEQERQKTIRENKMTIVN